MGEGESVRGRGRDDDYTEAGVNAALELDGAPAEGPVRRRVHGVIGQLDYVAVDGRRIDPAGFTVRDPRLPLLVLQPDGPWWGDVAGMLERVEVDGDLVRGEGWVTGVKPGRYPCGMTLAAVELMLSDEAGAPVSDEQWLGLIKEADPSALPGDHGLIQTVTRGELVSVALQLNDDRGVAFPLAVLVVE